MCGGGWGWYTKEYKTTLLGIIFLMPRGHCYTFGDIWSWRGSIKVRMICVTFLIGVITPETVYWTRAIWGEIKVSLAHNVSFWISIIS
jgi:hypothetical protein